MKTVRYFNTIFLLLILVISTLSSDEQNPMDMLWVRVSTQDGLIHNICNCLALAPDGTVWVGTVSGVSRIDRDGNISNFTGELFRNKPIQAIHISFDNIVWIGSSGAGLCRSSDNGMTWTQIPLPEESLTSITCIASQGLKIWVGTAGDPLSISGRLFFSKDGGSNWLEIKINNDLSMNDVRAIYPLSNDTVYVGLGRSKIGDKYTGGIAMTCNGDTWTPIATMSDKQINSILVDGKTIWIGTEGNGLYVSRDDGENWKQCKEIEQNISIRSIAQYNSSGLILATNRGAIISHNNGLIWQVLPFKGFGTTPLNTALQAPDGSIWAAVDQRESSSEGGVYVGKVLHATGIEELYVPKDSFQLAPNYPNPFERSTILTYKLPHSCSITLEIYDTIGRRIAVLADNQYQSAGEHSATWNVSESPSGVYFLQLTSDTGLYGVRKIVLF